VTNILGVDPGFGGALAVYDPLNRVLVEVIDMPVFEDRLGRIQLNAPELVHSLNKHADSIGLCIIEDVAARPGQGVTSMFRFGFSTGVITGIIAAKLIPIYKTPPAVWKSLMGLTRDKAQSLIKARETFPDQAHLFQLKKHADRAEAALLAVFGERVWDARQSVG